MVKHCCNDMENNIYYTSCCDMADANKNDDNKVVYYSSRFREYGIPVKNGNKIASSYILIQYCPWCGKSLPLSKRDEWFEELEKLGYDAPMEQDIPLKFNSSDWYE